jgi:glycosyltransferase involved in cell wall biosynthesis
MPLRILLDARHIRDFGFGTYIRNVLRGFVRLGAGEEFILVTRKADESEFAGLPPQYRLAFYEPSDEGRMQHVAFPMFVRQFNADLCHIPLNAVPLMMPRPYVVTVHDLSGLLYEPLPGWKQDLRLYSMRRGLLRAAGLIAVSDATRNDLEGLLGIPPRLIRRIHGAPDPRFIPGPGNESASPEDRRRILERYGINYPFLLYAGTIRPQKNIPRLVEAFALLRSELENHPVYADLRLIIIGDEISRYPTVRRTVIQSRVESAVRFLGFVPIDTLRVFYESAAAFVFPSLYEGFGLPPLEAMAAGTPVVTSNVTSLPEVVGDAAHTVSPDNVFDIARGIREVLLDEGLRATLRCRGAERLRLFSWERTAAETLDTYREIAGRGKKPS